MSVESLRDVTRFIEGGDQAHVLDTWSDQVQGVLRTGVEQGGPAARRLKNWLNGVWLGHPLHPALTDVPIGAWTVGLVLDVVGARHSPGAPTTAPSGSGCRRQACRWPPSRPGSAASWSTTRAPASPAMPSTRPLR